MPPSVSTESVHTAQPVVPDVPVATVAPIATVAQVAPKAPASAIPATSLARQLVSLATRLEHYAIRLERVDDSRCVFARCYALLTRELAKSIANDPTWHDPTWVVELAEGFAQRYFDAIDTYDAGLPAGQAWQHLQDEIREKRSSVLQDLVLGLIGHIVHDLPLALEHIWRNANDPASAIDDYHQVNDVLGKAIAKVRAELERLYNPYWHWLDWLAPSTLKLLTDEGLRLSRAAAWYNGLRLVDGRDHGAVRNSLEAVPVVFADQLFAPPGWAARVAIRTLNNLVSFGRRWPRSPVPNLPLPEAAAHQAYYFGTGVGHWRGSLRFEITDWAVFWAAKLTTQDRASALITALIMTIARKARLESRLDGFPDQGPMGVAASQIRVSVLGVPLYALREQYALGADGCSVHVRGYERVGPLGIGGTNVKDHSGRVEPGGKCAHYVIPVYGVQWQAEYHVNQDRNLVESVMRCAWGKAVESLERVSP